MTAPSSAAAPAARVADGASYSWWTGTPSTSRVEASGTTVGTVFQVRRTGVADQLRVYDASNRTNRYRLTLFTAGGKRLGSGVTRAGGARTGWRAVTLSRDVRLTPGRRYVVASASPRGAHVVAADRAARRGSLVPGRSRVGTTAGMPTRSIAGGALVDVVFRPRVGPFPTAATTGGPSESSLAAYNGPCTITRDGTVIDRKLVTCDLSVRARNVVVKHSVVHGTISTGGSGTSLSVVRSTIDVSPDGVRLETGIGDGYFKVIRSEVRGGNRGINCDDHCVVRDSWVHGQDTDSSGAAHESAVRMGSHAVIVGNTLVCDAPDVPPDAGCSASLTGYGDFAPVRNNLISGNYFPTSTGGTCAYGGSSGGKPYSEDAAGIRFVDNVFVKGRTGSCGYWAPIMDFDSSAPGNEWVGNAWESGGTVRP
ncbi:MULTISPECIES: DUF4082 domain-containing protein [unclassified Nocardioides]|uniref:DUF4082 domain-containing protein n=1 Tax=unclassified Nocardioides TaxID=2615069 RepID=UPI000AD1A77F|nr:MULTISPECIES: DUF4082 domain-containing protein [unclassified Nocardioides]